MVECFRQLKLPKLLLRNSYYNFGSYWAFHTAGPRFFTYMCHTSTTVRAELTKMCREADERAITDDRYFISASAWRTICQIYDHAYEERDWLCNGDREELVRRRYLRQLLN